MNLRVQGGAFGTIGLMMLALLAASDLAGAASPTETLPTPAAIEPRLKLSADAPEVLRLLSDSYSFLATRVTVPAATNRQLIIPFANSPDATVRGIAETRSLWIFLGEQIRQLNERMDRYIGPKGLSNPQPGDALEKWNEGLVNRAWDAARQRRPSLREVAGDFSEVFGPYLEMLHQGDALMFLSVVIYLDVIEQVRVMATESAQQVPQRTAVVAVRPAPIAWPKGYFDLTNQTGRRLTRCLFISSRKSDQNYVLQRYANSARALEFRAHTLDKDALFYIPEIPPFGCVRVKLLLDDALAELNAIQFSFWSDQAVLTNQSLPNIPMLAEVRRKALAEEWKRQIEDTRRKVNEMRRRR